jgi:hypothetical protein
MPNSKTNISRKEKERKVAQTNTVMWCNATCMQKQLTPNNKSITVKGNNRQYLKAIQAATRHRLN